jgi:hypothetical protein
MRDVKKLDLSHRILFAVNLIPIHDFSEKGKICFESELLEQE